MNAPRICLCFLLGLCGPSAFPQGSLTPPGIPAPTMKTLDQVEARTPLAGGTSPIVISSPGSYYLTASVTVASGDGITIGANNVTLDLNGFTVSTTAFPQNEKGIFLAGTPANITILNGFITGGVTNSGGVYNGPGFSYGIYCADTPRNVRVAGVNVAGCMLHGIYLALGSSVVESCTVNTVGGQGILAQSVSQSIAVNSGDTAITANTVNNSYGYSSGTGDGVSAGTANGCIGSSANGYGVFAFTASNCYGNSASGNGLYCVGTADGCYGVSSTLRGLQAKTANNCYGYSAGSGTALVANAANNSYAENSGDGDGIAATVANNCSGASATSAGVGTLVANNCYGSSSSGTGLGATTATNCFGRSSSGTGLSAANSATSCYGSSVTGTGLFAVIANSCGGTSFSVTYKYNMPP